MTPAASTQASAAAGASSAPCPQCDDGDGGCAYPYYGVAPHEHKSIDPMAPSWIGSTVLLPKSAWPENFREDPEEEGCGTYTHCLLCGAPARESKP